MNDNKMQANDWPTKAIAFRIDDQEFCIDVMSVWEIRCWTQETPLPSAPCYVRGVINLRGVVLPIVDLAARLGFRATTAASQHVVIVVQIGRRTVGLLVDAVSDILTVTAEKVQPTPDIFRPDVESFVRGVLVDEGRMTSLITLTGLLPSQEQDAA